MRGLCSAQTNKANSLAPCCAAGVYAPRHAPPTNRFSRTNTLYTTRVYPSEQRDDTLYPLLRARAQASTRADELSVMLSVMLHLP